MNDCLSGDTRALRLDRNSRVEIENFDDSGSNLF